MRTLTLMTVVLLAVVVMGCAANSGPGLLTPKDRIYAPSADWQQTRTIVHPDGRIETVTTKGAATGVGYKGPNADELKVDPPHVGPEGAGGGGGAAGFVGRLKSLSANVYILGALLIVGAAAIGYFVSWKLGLIVGAGGLVGIACIHFIERYPWMVGVAVLAGVGVVIYALVKVRRSETDEVTLDAIVRAIAATPGEATEALKKKIAEIAGKNKATVKATVTRVKNGG